MAITIRTCELEMTAKAVGGDAFTNSEVGNNAIALSQAISLKRIADALDGNASRYGLNDLTEALREGNR